MCTGLQFELRKFQRKHFGRIWRNIGIKYGGDLSQNLGRTRAADIRKLVGKFNISMKENPVLWGYVLCYQQTNENNRNCRLRHLKDT
jgi:hypothetical protein